ncbi:MAG: molecular chaperone HtpG [Lachnospiraceae bacterium]|jgi:molecular chaperone HtpG|nr:molecular chaperone HtpG [Lachnospiraceae bacterium]
MSLEEKGTLSINSENLFPIIKKWLYSDQDIFIRELVSNAVDAIQKFKHLASLGEAVTDGAAYEVHIHLDPEQKTITISDNGIGMTADEVKKYINQIAFSGAAEFMEKYKDSSEDPIIGHFGLGFYSAFMVSSLVEIQTLSYQEGAEAVCWTCDGGSTFEMTAGSRTARGTDIILHVNEDGEKYLQKYEMQTIAGKYCSFMAVPVYLTSAEDNSKADDTGKAEKQGEASSSDDAAQEAPKPINETSPLWLKNPKDCTDDEYKDFYRKVFMDFKEPLFWIHLNMDYPFNLKGILYFPKLGNEFESAEGQVKLYCNQVFVADNVKEIIPEFLLLLKGAIDCPDIPLNVSRSFLQNDGYVRKISEYITKKVADKLCQLYTKDRENYEKYWSDIHPFIKYGCLRNEKFYDRVKDSIIYRSINENKYITLSEYLEAAKEKHENKVFYTTDARQQAQYLQLLKAQEMDAVELGTAIDSPFISLLESKNQDLHFLRVDADLNEVLKDKDTAVAEKDQEAAEKLFRELLGADQLKIRLESLRDEKVSAIIEMTEEARRMQEMMKMYGAMGLGAMPAQADETLVLNMHNALVAYILDHPKEEKAAALAHQIYDLARLSHAPLSAEALTAFLTRSQELLQDLI